MRVMILFSVFALLVGCSETKTQELVADTDLPLSNDDINGGKLDNPVVKVVTGPWYTPDNTVALADAVKAFEKDYNAKVEWTAMGWPEQRQTFPGRVKSGDVWDLWLSEMGPDYPDVEMNGYLQPIDQYVHIHDPEFSQLIVDSFRYAGKYYGVNSTKAQQPYILIYNKTLFDEQGEKTPEAYYKEGDWNWLNFSKVVMDMTKDLNGDGKIDQYGLQVQSESQYIANNGGSLIRYNTDGTLAVEWNTVNNRDTMKMLQNLSSLHHAVVGSWQVYRDQLFHDRKIAMYSEGASKILDMIPADKHDTKDVYDWVPFPTAPDTNGSLMVPFNNSAWVIPRGARNPVGAGILASYIVKYCNLEYYGSFAKHLASRPDKLKMYNDVINHMVPDIDMKIPGLDIGSIAAVWNDGKPVDAAMQEQLKVLEEQVKQFNVKVLQQNQP
jgi:maltose-binding protein MalE